MRVDEVAAQHDEAAGDLAEDVGVVEDAPDAAVLPRRALEGRLPVAEGGDVDLLRAQHLLELRAGHHDEVGGVLRQPRAVQRLADRVVEVRAERVDRDRLARDVGQLRIGLSSST